MITSPKVANILREVGIPFRYKSFKKNDEATLPYLIYYSDNESTVKMDNRTLTLFENFTIELVTIKRDLALEKKLEDTLAKYELDIELVDEFFLENEELLVRVYEIQ